MSKSKKKERKVKHLSDEDYSQYIMQLKDENPPMLYRNNREEKQ